LATPNLAKPVPRHVAIIMDGNGRWAQARGMPRVAGHKRGLDAVRAAITTCAKSGVEFLTVFAFSSENWQRPAEEVGFLMRLFLGALEREVGQLNANNVRLRVVGDLSAFEPSLQAMIAKCQETTQHNTGLNFTIAANYGGRWDITQATKKLIASGVLANEVTEHALAEHLAMHFAPDPDLFIRTGGETRISNFLLWQLAYCELHFTPVFWPDFDEQHLLQAFTVFSGRERRYGKTSAQVAVPSTTPCLEPEFSRP
jgi:undecaprenyl diphosphate synthase